MQFTRGRTLLATADEVVLAALRFQIDVSACGIFNRFRYSLIGTFEVHSHRDIWILDTQVSRRLCPKLISLIQASALDVNRKVWTGHVSRQRLDSLITKTLPISFFGPVGVYTRFLLRLRVGVDDVAHAYAHDDADRGGHK